jgi:DNA repair exonuclease SbcCD ATPase subunit
MSKIRLHRLLVENYRGIEHLDLKFVDNPRESFAAAVIGGSNGSGKTSILEAALLAINADRQLLRPTSIGQEAVRQGASDYRIFAQFSIDGSSYEVERGAFRHSPKLPRPLATYFSSWRSQRYVGGLPITAGKSGRRPDSRNEENRLWIIKQFLINSRAHDLFREKSGSPSGTNGNMSFEEVVARLNRIWHRFYPQTNETFSVDEISDDPDAGFDVFIRWSNQTKVALDNLSSGQQELVTIFGWFICNRLDGGLIVIDEPELHLDHSWHRLMMSAMHDALPNSQFLVATHSPEIYESAYSYARFFLESSKLALSPVGGAHP